MDSLTTIFLGIIQGLTEFLPVSSSGHLVLFQNLLGFNEPELLLDSSLHFGTLLAICFYFRYDIKAMAVDVWRFFKPTLNTRGRSKNSSVGFHASMFFWVLVGSVPTALIGLIFEEPLEALFGSVSTVGIMLIVTGTILAATRFHAKGNEGYHHVGILAAVAVGAAQGFAIIPGISRSGATIACGLLCGLSRDLAGRFSFLLSVPAIIGALVLQLNVESFGRLSLWPLFLGVTSSAIVGFLALRLLMGMVRKGHLSYFAPYCWAVGLIIVIFL
jgi:undecaprenyl-diphosphatase